MVEGSVNTSYLPTFAAPNTDIRKTDSVPPPNEITTTATRAGDKYLSSLWIQRLNPRDSPREEETYRVNPLETCGDVVCLEKLDQNKTKSLQSSEAISTVKNSALTEQREIKSWWKLGSGISIDAEVGTKDIKQKHFNVSAVSSGISRNRERLLKKEQAGFLQSRYGFGPRIRSSSSKRNSLVQQRDLKGSSNDLAAKSEKPLNTERQVSNSIACCNPDAASGGLTKPLLPPVSKNLLFYLRHIHEKKRGISSHQTSFKDFSLSSIQQVTLRDPSFQKPQDVIRSDFVSDGHVKGPVTDGSSQVPCTRGKYNKGLSKTTGSINLSEEIIVEEMMKQCSASECQLSEIPSSDLCLKVSNEDLGVSCESRKLTADVEPMVTMLCLESSQLRTPSKGEDRNVLTAFDLCVKASHGSQHAEERAHKRVRWDLGNQIETNGEKGISRDIDDRLVLDLNIDICADEVWNQPSSHVQSEQREVVVKRNTEPSQFLDVMVKTMTAKQEKGTICFFNGISKQTAGFTKDQVPLKRRIEQSSSTDVFSHRPKLSIDLNEEYMESASADELELSQYPCEMHENICGKSQRDVSDDLTSQDIAKKCSAVQSPSMYQIWIQRWCSATFHNGEGMSSHARVFIDGARRNCYRYLALGVNQLKDGDFCRIFAAGTTGMIDNASVESDQALEEFKLSYAKATPSAAAMAIVGTAARQFCNISSQQKRSFGFWSGLGKGKTSQASKSEL